MPILRKPKGKQLEKKPKDTNQDIHNFIKNLNQKEVTDILREMQTGKKGRTNYKYLINRIKTLIDRKAINPKLGRKIIEKLKKKAA